jgi:ribosomal protein S12 methylthiotransferase accessory factor
MQDYCRLKGNLGYRIVGSDDVFILSETRSFHLSGKAYPVLLPLLQHGFLLRDLLQKLPAGITLPELAFAIKNLKQHRLISHFPSPAEAPNALFWDSLGLDGREVTQQLQQAGVSLLDLSGKVDTASLGAALRKLGIALASATSAETNQASNHTTTRPITTSTSDNPGLTLVLVDDYLDPALEAINQRHLASGQPWLLAKPHGEMIWIGPFFLPGQSACWQCLQHRILYRRKLEEYLHAQGQSGSKPHSAHFSASDALAQAILCAEIAKFMALQGSEMLPEHLPALDHVLTINPLNYQREEHRVVKRPQCPCCGNPAFMAEQQSSPLRLGTSAAVMSRDGGLRQKSAQEIVDQLQHHISPVIGIIGVTNTLALDGDEQGITTSVAAEHNFSLIDSASSFQQERIRSCSGGKGKTVLAARAGALCESIERFSGVFQGDEKRIAARMAELPNAIHPNDCLLYSEAQYARREQHNLSASRMTWIPERFDPQQVIEWTPLWSLTHQAFYYLPTTWCFYGYARLHDCRFAKADSNGCAAGSNLDEAVLQGFLELVERDAAAIWWYNRRRKQGVDLASFDDPYLLSVEQYYQRNGMRLWVLDISSDLGIPVFAALCARPGAAAEQITFAFGAHFDAKIALVRAVSELNQIMPNVTLDAATTLKSLGVEAADWWRTVRLAEQPYLSPGPGAPRTLADYADMSQLGLNQALQSCIAIAKDKGLNLLVLDQSRPDTGLAVVKVVVPSLRHFWPRLAAGRLYSGGDDDAEAEAKAGAKAEAKAGAKAEAKAGAKAEAELNPWPIFI